MKDEDWKKRAEHLCAVKADDYNLYDLIDYLQDHLETCLARIDDLESRLAKCVDLSELPDTPDVRNGFIRLIKDSHNWQVLIQPRHGLIWGVQTVASSACLKEAVETAVQEYKGGGTE